MTEPRRVRLDASPLPACHVCGAPAVLEYDRYRIQHVSWRHEPDCAVLRSADERLRLNTALTGAVAALRQEDGDA